MLSETFLSLWNYTEALISKKTVVEGGFWKVNRFWWGYMGEISMEFTVHTRKEREESWSASVPCLSTGRLGIPFSNSATSNSTASKSMGSKPPSAKHHSVHYFCYSLKWVRHNVKYTPGRVLIKSLKGFYISGLCKVSLYFLGLDMVHCPYTMD